MESKEAAPQIDRCDIMIASGKEVGMAQLVVRNLEDAVKKKLQRRAKRNGRSMEEEAREILRDATKEEERKVQGLGTRIAARFRKYGLRKGEELAKLPPIVLQPPNFEE
jgi:antitoxin FitA